MARQLGLFAREYVRPTSQVCGVLIFATLEVAIVAGTVTGRHQTGLPTASIGARSSFEATA